MDTSSTQKRDRVLWIDILRGLMMFLVIYGHASCSKDIKKYIFSFHMPIFFMISGMTFCFNKEFDTLKYIWKKFKGLIIPYFLLNLYVSGLWYYGTLIDPDRAQTLPELIKGVLISNVDSGYKMASNTTWFITCLFLTDILFFFLRKLCRSDLVLSITTILMTLAFYAAGFISKKGGGIWHWQVAFTAVIFYLAGYLFLKNIAVIKQKLTFGHRYIFLIPLLLFGGFWFSKINSRVSLVNDQYGNVAYFYLSAFMTCLSIITLMMVLCENQKVVKCLQPINFIGQTTLTYIAFHVPIIRLLKYYFKPVLDNNEPMRFLMSLAIYIGLIPLAWVVQKLLPGKNNIISYMRNGIR